jgi:hypothetical protein
MNNKTNMKIIKVLKQETETCISCNKETHVPINLNIELREYYIEGAGQLCEKCYNKIYSKKWDA